MYCVPVRWNLFGFSMAVFALFYIDVGAAVTTPELAPGSTIGLVPQKLAPLD